MTEPKTIFSALVGALADLTVIEKGHTANAGSYSYAYADLGDIVKLTRPVLAAWGLTVVQNLHAEGTGLAVTTSIVHSSGETRDFGPLTFPYGRDAQATGSAITYHRRYALLAALGMATGEDDDGAKAVPADPVPPVPGFRRSLMDAVAALSSAEKELLRAWLVEEGLPDRPSKMNAAQAERVVEYILHGLPKGDG